jgi:hypothetical protein
MKKRPGKTLTGPVISGGPCTFRTASLSAERTPFGQFAPTGDPGT